MEKTKLRKELSVIRLEQIQKDYRLRMLRKLQLRQFNRKEKHELLVWYRIRKNKKDGDFID